MVSVRRLLFADQNLVRDGAGNQVRRSDTDFPNVCRLKSTTRGWEHLNLLCTHHKVPSPPTAVFLRIWLIWLSALQCHWRDLDYLTYGWCLITTWLWGSNVKLMESRVAVQIQRLPHVPPPSRKLLRLSV